MPELVKGYYARRNLAGQVLESKEQDIYKGDLIDAVAKFPKEWSFKPWKLDADAEEDSEEDIAAAAAAKTAGKKGAKKK